MVDKKKKKRSNIFKSAIQWLWCLFASVRLAVILLLIITGLSLLGALLIQAPREITGNPQVYQNWIDTIARNKVGIWVPLLSALGLFDVFHSAWFVTLCALLILNILICSLNRWKSIVHNIRGGKVKQIDGFYSDGKLSGTVGGLMGSESGISSLAEKILGKRGYRVRTEKGKNGTYIAADKNRYYRLGTYFSHFSLILFVIAFILGNFLGFRDNEFAVAENGIREVGHDTTLSLELSDFTAEYYDNGTPSDFRSDVALYDNGQPVRQAVIRVNHPLIYEGIRFYQSYFGPAMDIQVKDINGQDIFKGGVALDGSFELEGIKRLEGFFDLPEAGVSVRLISPAVNTADFIIPEGNVAIDIRDANGQQIGFQLAQLGVPEKISGLEFIYLGESLYSGFQVSRDPGNILIWIASAFFFIGICAVLYFPYRQAWVLVRQQEKNYIDIMIRTRAPRGYRSTAELDTIIDMIKKSSKKQII